MELTALIERYQHGFNAQYAQRITRQQRQAIDAVMACHTERYGEMRLSCSPCQTQQSRFHSCGHRSCPRCQHHDTTQWLERQQQKLLPVDYFMVTFTLPYELRALTWHHQKRLSSILFDCAVDTLKTFGFNDERLSGSLAMTGVLHTHTRRLDYHPHVHVIVPGGCFDNKRVQWIKHRGKYLFNAFNLATVFRAKVLQSILKAGFRLPDNIPAKWVVDCQHVGEGLPALHYLSRYLYRGVISEKNIIDDDGTHVTFRYQDNETNTWKTRTVTGETFIGLVFQHVLPKGFRRVRDYGFLHGNAKHTLQRIQALLGVLLPKLITSCRAAYRCVLCGKPMTIVAFIPPAWRAG